jgi:TonB family protein
VAYPRILFTLILLSLAIHGAIGGILVHWSSALRTSTDAHITSYEVAVAEGPKTQSHPVSPSFESDESSDAGLGSPASPASKEITQGSAGSKTDSAPSALDLYAAQVRERVQEKLRYPLSLRRREVAGRVHLHLILNANGLAQALEISESSGSHELDELALEAARAGAPYPAAAAELVRTGNLILDLPIEFKLK